jgi:hypothetical protein
MIDATAPRFGLPASLWIPIAAVTVADIETYVGRVLQSVKDPTAGLVNAVLVESGSRSVTKEPNVPLWKSSLAGIAGDRLYPPRQVWVHVDYGGYRQAYIQFGMPVIPPNYFLDHVQNRKAIGLRDDSHPYLRLCPVHRGVNTSGGHSAGGEGMEKRFLASHAPPPGCNRIIYADPMDLTKMLDISPGTQILDGVRETQRLFYP